MRVRFVGMRFTKGKKAGRPPREDAGTSEDDGFT
jgi:hypothetical protein